MSNTIKILDLFSGSQSVKKSLLNIVNFNYIGVDISNFNNTKNNVIMDLSDEKNVNKLTKLLKDKNFMPDVVWASPPCETFSRATSIKGGTLSFEKVPIPNGRIMVRNWNIGAEKKIVLRKNWEVVKQHKSYRNIADNKEWQEKNTEKGKQALKMIHNTFEIINLLEPKLFIIENPYNGLLKDYLKVIRAPELFGNDEFLNRADYCRYGTAYKKPTLIYGDRKFDFLKCNHKVHKEVLSSQKKLLKIGQKHAVKNNYERSKVPPELIKKILEREIKWRKNYEKKQRPD